MTYETQCTKWQTVTVDKTPDPAVVTAHSAKGLKPGMNAFVARGEVIGAWVKGSKTPAFLAGVALKKQPSANVSDRDQARILDSRSSGSKVPPRS